jgi:hypothetical protein
MISGFRRDVNEICALLGCYAAQSGDSVPTFGENLSVPSSRVKISKKKAQEESFILGILILEDGTDTLSRNVYIELALCAT